MLETFSQPVTEHLILQFQNHRGQQLFSLRHDMIYSQQLSQQYFPSGTHSAAVTAAGRSSVQCQSKPSLIEDETLLQSVCARRWSSASGCTWRCRYVLYVKNKHEKRKKFRFLNLSWGNPLHRQIKKGSLTNPTASKLCSQMSCFYHKFGNALFSAQNAAWTFIISARRKWPTSAGWTRNWWLKLSQSSRANSRSDRQTSVLSKY